MRVHDCGNFFSIVWYRRWGPYKRAICFFIDIWNHSTSCKSSNKISIIFSQLVNCLCSLAAEQQQRVYVYRHHTGVSKVPTLNRHLIASGGILKYFLIVCRTSPNPHVDISKRNGHRKSWKGRGMIGAPIFFATPLLLLLLLLECKEFQILHDIKVSGRSIIEIGAKMSQARLFHSFQIPKLLNVQRYVTERNRGCPRKKQ